MFRNARPLSFRFFPRRENRSSSFLIIFSNPPIGIWLGIAYTPYTRCCTNHRKLPFYSRDVIVVIKTWLTRKSNASRIVSLADNKRRGVDPASVYKRKRHGGPVGMGHRARRDNIHSWPRVTVDSLSIRDIGPLLSLLDRDKGKRYYSHEAIDRSGFTSRCGWDSRLETLTFPDQS